MNFLHMFFLKNFQWYFNPIHVTSFFFCPFTIANLYHFYLTVLRGNIPSLSAWFAILSLAFFSPCPHLCQGSEQFHSLNDFTARLWDCSASPLRIYNLVEERDKETVNKIGVTCATIG